MNELAKKGGMEIVKYMKSPSIQKMINEKIGKNKGEFVSNLITVSQNNDLVAQCDPQQLLVTALQSTLLNLSLNPNLGEAYLVPFKIRGKATASLIVGYKGIIQLAIRTAEYKKIIATEVREGEIIFNKFTEEIEFGEPNPDGEIVGYYAMFELLNGFVKAIYSTIDEIKNHADSYSKAYNRHIGDKLENGEEVKDAWKYSSPWYTDFGAMAKKTLLLRILKQYGVKSVQMQSAIKTEEESKNMREVNEETETQEFISEETTVPANTTNEKEVEKVNKEEELFNEFN